MGQSKEYQHPIHVYARNIIAGKIPANKWVTLACKRHCLDKPWVHKTPKKATRGLYFDHNAANRVINFFPVFLKFYEGAFDGQPFNLTPNQVFIVGSIFGWKRKIDDCRRFRTAYCEMGKGQGKTPLLAGIGLYGLTFDSEPGAEVYAAATTKEQAGILFRDARLYAEASESLKDMLIVDKYNIANNKANSFFRAISSEHRGLDGKRPHMALIDEIHEHPNDLVVRKMSAGMKGRRQGLQFEITNSGYDRHSICFQHHEYTEKILEGTIQDDAWFGIMTGLDVCPRCEAEGKTIPQDGCPDCDDWRDESVWEKANPNLNYLGAPFRDYLRRQVEEAKAMPSQENIVKRLNFCVWTEGETKWITAEKWNACKDESLNLNDFIGQPCYIGLDLASKIDICAVILLFETEKGFAVFGKYYLPEDTIRESKNTQYKIWVRQGLLTQTPGARTDFKFIEDDLKAINKTHPIMQLAFDPRESGYLVNNIMEWTNPDVCVEINQGPALMSEPMKELEARIYGREIWHNGDPILSWMMSNVVLKESRGGPIKYYYPTKTNVENKIDGAVALVMAIGRAMSKIDTRSAYENLTSSEINDRMAL